MQEETGLAVKPGRLVGRVQRPGLAELPIDIRDYAATVTGAARFERAMTPPMRAGWPPRNSPPSRSPKA